MSPVTKALPWKSSLKCTRGGVLFYICCGVLSKNTNKRSSAAAVVDQMIGRTPNMKTKAEKEIYPQKEKKSQKWTQATFD